VLLKTLKYKLVQEPKTKMLLKKKKKKMLQLIPVFFTVKWKIIII